MVFTSLTFVSKNAQEHIDNLMKRSRLEDCEQQKVLHMQTSGHCINALSGRRVHTLFSSTAAT